MRGWPPLPIALICALTVVSAAIQIARELPSIRQSVDLYPAGWEPVAYAIALVMAAFFLITIVGLWRMRKWAVVARIGVHVIAPIQMTIAWNDSWQQYPLLGPFVSWFWFGVLLVCTLPYWGRMTWRFP